MKINHEKMKETLSRAEKLRQSIRKKEIQISKLELGKISIYVDDSEVRDALDQKTKKVICSLVLSDLKENLDKHWDQLDAIMNGGIIND